MNDWAHIIVDGVFSENLALSYFLGMCTFLAVSKQVQTAIGVGLAIIVIQSITVPLNHVIFESILREHALDWAGLGDEDLSFLKVVVFIGTIAATVQITELFLQRYWPSLHRSLGVYLPLITVNCAILGASLFMAERHYTLVDAAAYGFGTGLGWAIAITLFSAIRQRTSLELVPVGLRDSGLAFIITGIISMSFSSIAGQLP